MTEPMRAPRRLPAAVAHVVPQIDDPTDNFRLNHFRDVGVGNSPCDYCHIDATYNLLQEGRRLVAVNLAELPR